MKDLWQIRVFPPNILPWLGGALSKDKRIMCPWDANIVEAIFTKYITMTLAMEYVHWTLVNKQDTTSRLEVSNTLVKARWTKFLLVGPRNGLCNNKDVNWLDRVLLRSIPSIMCV